MAENISSFIRRLKSDKRILSFDESRTKQEVILQLLYLLEWNPFNSDEVCPEYSIGGKRVDYSLRIGDSNKVFLEVKKIGEDLENHQEQLLNYSFQQGVKLAILTNGLTWWFYLPLKEGVWEQRKFYSIDILQQETEDIVSKFSDFLSKGNVASSNAVDSAEAIYKSQQRHKALQEALPKAWNMIISEPDSLLLDMINETAEKICGYKPDEDMIRKFLKDHKDNFIVPSLPYVTPVYPEKWSKSELTQYLKDSSPYQRILLSALAQPAGEPVTVERVISRMNGIVARYKPEGIDKKITGYTIGGARGGLTARRKSLKKEDIIDCSWSPVEQRYLYAIKADYKQIVLDWVKRENLLMDTDT